MTLAVAEGLMNGWRAEPEEMKKEIVKAMQRLGRRYPNAGYGGMFHHWLLAEKPAPYNSFGNGSAMRVSSVAWLYDDLAAVLQQAALTAEVTHNHPEGIKGAQATAAIFLARTGADKRQIKSYIAEAYYGIPEKLQQKVPAFLDGQRI